MRIDSHYITFYIIYSIEIKNDEKRLTYMCSSRPLSNGTNRSFFDNSRWNILVVRQPRSRIRIYSRLHLKKKKKNEFYFSKRGVNPFIKILKNLKKIELF